MTGVPTLHRLDRKIFNDKLTMYFRLILFSPIDVLVFVIELAVD